HPANQPDRQLVQLHQPRRRRAGRRAVRSRRAGPRLTWGNGAITSTSTVRGAGAGGFPSGGFEVAPPREPKHPAGANSAEPADPSRLSRPRPARDHPSPLARPMRHTASGSSVEAGPRTLPGPRRRPRAAGRCVALVLAAAAAVLVAAAPTYDDRLEKPGDAHRR